MYNTNFVVRYRDIENELIKNLHRIELKKQAKELEKELQLERDMKAIQAQALALTQAKLIKKKGGEKKTDEPAIVDEPKKRGRKKAVKVDEEVNVPIPVEEVNVPVPVDEVNVPVVDDEDDDEDLVYTLEDVHLICDKLYRDELLSVFEVESTNDPNMDIGMKRVIEKMIDNANFKQLLEDIKNEIIDVSKFTGTPEEIAILVRNSEYVIFITLFSQHVFYMTHRCICQLFTINDITPEMITLLKNKTVSLFKK